MRKKIFREIHIDSPVEIKGCIFSGLQAIRGAVGKFARISDSLFGSRNVFEVEPKGDSHGMYVLQMYEPYPCFDSEDYADEDRDYCNLFFSDQPFTEQQIEQLAHVEPEMDFRIINERTPEWAFPAVYYRGDGDIMLVASLE